MPTQAKLLRVVQDGVVRRVGSTGTDAVVNVRFIAATNRDPSGAVRDGNLREDLYYRLRVVPIHIPPLRQRPDDIPALAEHFLDVYWQRHRGRSTRPSLSEGALRTLQARPWKGNVRELQNVIEHAVVLARPAEPIEPEDIPQFENGPEGLLPAEFGSVGVSMFASGGYHEARERVLARFERDYLGWVLQHAEGNMSEAARVAGVDRTTLYRLMSKHGLDKSELLEE
jgi:DNA-binding NtrC family response regulator